MKGSVYFDSLLAVISYSEVSCGLAVNSSFLLACTFMVISGFIISFTRRYPVGEVLYF